MGSNPVLEMRQITKSFGDVNVLRNVDLSVNSGSVMGFVGGNGSGKSTTMNILGGIHQLDSGNMTFDGKAYAPANPRDARLAGIAFIHQELNLFPNMSVQENLLLEDMPTFGNLPIVNTRLMQKLAKGALEEVGLNVSPKILLGSLSPGEWQLVEIAKALIGSPKLIIFDEPTTSLTAPETERLFEIIENLKSRGLSQIYISHALQDVLRISDQILILRDGEVVDDGPVEDFPLDRLVTGLIGRKLEQAFPARDSNVTTETILSVKNLTKKGVLKDVSFDLHKGEVLGLLGLMGSGRTETARMIFGLDSYAHGEIMLKGEKLAQGDARAAIEKGIAFLTENRREEGIMLTETISANVALPNLDKFSRMGLVDFTRIEEQVREISKTVHLKAPDGSKTIVRKLSGGNQQKVVLGKWLELEPDVFILDEPTRGIDIGAKFEIYKLVNEMVEAGNSVLMISSEIEELIGLCDRIAVMQHGEIVKFVDRNDGFDESELTRLMVSGFARAS